MRIARVLSLGGLTAPLWLAGSVIVSGFMRPEYNHIRQMISELGEFGAESSGFMSYVGLVVTGLLIFLFSLSTFMRFPRSGKWIAASLAMALAGLSVVIAGIFPCDPGCDVDSPSQAQLLHTVSAFLAFLLLITSSLLWSPRFRELRDWHPMSRFSVFAGVVTFVLLAGFVGLTDRSVAGLIQRLFLGLILLCLGVFAVRLWLRWESIEDQMTEGAA